ncbi:MAG TPA: F0F1 ATP synthase subunit A [Armatimonadota bacterium]|jgi:F-type H+-transporting ATPase subunit a
MTIPTVKLGEPEPIWFDPLWKKIPLPYVEFFIVTLVVVAVLSIWVMRSTRNLRRKDIGPMQAMWELVGQGFVGFVEGIMGPGQERYVPLIGTLFIFILTMNLFGIIPGFISPTASLNTTIALALSVFFVVQFEGLRTQGLKHYVMHFVGEPWQLGFIMLPLHIIGELAKPLSLSLRLAGNVFAEDAVIAIVAAMSPLLYMILRVHWAQNVPLFPMQIVILPLMIFFGMIQAFVFSMLSTIYISLMVGEGHSEHEEAPAH